MIISFLGVLSSILIARFYGAEILGLVSYLNSYLLICSALCALGLGQRTLKPLKELEIKKTLLVVLSCGLVCGSILVTYLSLMDIKLFDSVFIKLLFLVALCALALNRIFLSIVRKASSKRLFIFVSAIPTISRFLIIIFSCFVFVSEYLVVGSTLLAPVILLSFYVYHYSKSHLRVNNSSKTKILSFRTYVSEGFPFMKTELAFVLLMSVDLIIIKYFCDYSDVGKYSVAITFIGIVFMIEQSVQTFLSPNIAKYFEQKMYSDVKKQMILSSFVCFLFTLVSFLIAYAVLDYIISYFYGEEFMDAYNFFLIITGGLLIKSFFGFSGNFMNMCGFQKEFSKLMIVISFVNVLLVIAFTYLFGVYGAAFSTSISYIFWGALPYFFLKKNGITVTFLSFALKE